MNWKKASDTELVTVIVWDRMARGSEIVAAKEELERRGLKVPQYRMQFRLKAVYPK